jgi:hypothetical protein
MNSKIDPAALLIAIVPVAAGPLLEAGAWDRLNSVVALVVLIVLWAFTLADQQRRQRMSGPECIAVSAVIGLISAIVLAFPIQWLRSGTTSSDPPPPDGNGPSLSAIDFATWRGLQVGVAIFVVLAIVLWIQAKPSGDAQQTPQKGRESP